MFGVRLKELRKSKKMTQKQLADLVFVDCSSVTKWETGKAYPDFEKQNKLADFFNVSIDYLLGKSDLRNPLDIPEHIEGIADLILRMRSDDEFSDIINKINELSPEQLKAISTILSSMN